MGLLFSGLSSICLGIGLMIIMAIMVAFYVAVFIGIATLIIGGSTAAPALVFALLFTMGKSDNLIVSILIFAVSYYAIKRLIQYKKVENAIMVHLAVAGSAIATFSLKMVISFFFDRTPALILLVLMVGIMLFMLSPVLASDHQNGKKGYPIITRLVASVLYGSAINTLLGSVAILFDINVSNAFVVFTFFLWVFSSAAAYILDMKLSENGAFIKTIQEMPVCSFVKKYYDKYEKVILEKLAKYKKA